MTLSQRDRLRNRKRRQRRYERTVARARIVAARQRISLFSLGRVPLLLALELRELSFVLGPKIAHGVEHLATCGGRLEERACEYLPTSRIGQKAAEWVATLRDALSQYPYLVRFAVMALVVLASVLHPARATHAGLLNDISNSMQTFGGQNGGTWMDNSLNLAKSLFSYLAIFVIASTAIRYYLARHTFRGGAPLLLRTFVMIAIPLAILDSAGLVLGGLFQIAGQITQAIAPGQFNAQGISPDGVYNIGSDTMDKFQGAYFSGVGKAFSQHSTCGFTDPGCWAGFIGNKTMQLGFTILLALVVLVEAFICRIMFLFIAAELLFAYAYAFLSLPLGAWTLGFSALEATSDIAARYWTTVLQVLMRFVVIFGMIAFVTLVFQNYGVTLFTVLTAQWPNIITQTGAFGTQLNTFLTAITAIAVSSVALAYIVLRTAATADSIAGGRVGFSAGAMGRDAMFVARTLG